MPAADLLSSALLHVLPVELLLLAAAVLAQCDPAHHLLALHAAAAVDGDEQRDVRQLEERHLEDEGLLVDGVGLASPHRRLAPRDLLADRVQQRQPPEGVCSRSGEGGRGQGRGRGGEVGRIDFTVRRSGLGKLFHSQATMASEV